MLENERQIFSATYPQFAQQLRRAKDEIIKEWEAQVRERVSPAGNLSKLALWDSFPEFLEKLASTLSVQNKKAPLEAVSTFGKKHGEERARQSCFNISEILFEYCILRDVIFDFLSLQQPLPDPARKIVLYAIDQGILAAVEKFAEERTRALEQSNRDLENFAVMAAHDLKSPLATISGYLEQIKESIQDGGDDDVLSCIQAVQRTTARLTLTTDRLLDYSSVRKNAAPFTDMATRDVVNQVLESLKASIENADAEVEVGSLPVVEGDRLLLAMVFQNLIGNSVKFRSGRKLKITVCAIDEGDRWVFAVADNGIGFETKRSVDIFSIFTQVHYSRRHQGFGVGLAIAKKVVDIHDGDIWAESEPGVGSTFYFSIPK